MMSLKPKIDMSYGTRMDWRTSQRMFKREAAAKKLVRRLVCLVALAMVVYGIGSGAPRALEWTRALFSIKEDTDVAGDDGQEIEPTSDANHLVKRDLKTVFTGACFTNLLNQSFESVFEGRPIRVDTSLNVSLQQYLHGKLARSISKHTGIVIMDPASGRVLSMVSFDKRHPENNPCVDGSFPAASVFKIVTATAAIDKCGFQLNKTFSFNGGKYTLYKSQLKNRTNRYTNHISFKDSFAQSINPVFGKIGSQHLGPETLKTYATAFGFNRQINFEIELPPSRLTLGSDPYQWAEIACGFNRDTTLSPVHGALMAATILNRGAMPEPSIVDQVTDAAGCYLYKNRPVSLGQAVASTTCEKVAALMQRTVRSGTCRKAFRGYRRDRTLSKLRLGGKTGSINNKARDARIDWFVGFAEQKDGSGALALSVVVAHEKYIGTRASEYARMAIMYYFKNLSANRTVPPKVRG